MYKFFTVFGHVLPSYRFVSGIALIVQILFIFTQIQKNGFLGYLKLLQERDKLVQTTILCCILAALCLALSLNIIPIYLVSKPFSSLFHDFTGETNAASYFGWIAFAPLTFFIMAFILGMKPLKTLDSVAPGLALALIFAKLACFCGGCCNGFQTYYGFYNKKTLLTEFPVQLVESAEALIIFFILLKLRKKAKLGTIYPIYLMLYSGMRFFSEFLRAYPDYFGHFKIGHILALALFSLGALETALALKFGERIDSAFATCYAKIEKKLKRS